MHCIHNHKLLNNQCILKLDRTALSQHSIQQTSALRHVQASRPVLYRHDSNTRNVSRYYEPERFGKREKDKRGEDDQNNGMDRTQPQNNCNNGVKKRPLRALELSGVRGRLWLCRRRFPAPDIAVGLRSH